MIRTAIKARLNLHNLEGSLATVCSLYEKSRYEDEAKYGIIHKATKVYKHLVDFLHIKGTRAFRDLNDTIIEYV